MMPAILRRTWAQVMILVAVSGVLFFSNLDRRPLWPPDEPRYFRVAKETLDHGDWILLNKDGEIYTDKPPLFFWSVALSFALWQRADNFSARFPSALFGVVTVVLTFFCGRTLFGAGVGFISALILATTPQFAWLATRVNIDATLTCFTTLALFSFASWHKVRQDPMSSNKGRALLFGYYGAMAIATLTKGPVGCILPTIVVLMYVLLLRDWDVLRSMRLPAGSALFASMVSLWFVPAALQGGASFLREVVLRHSIQRFAQGMDHAAPFYFYLERFAPGFFPWVLFLPAGIFLALSGQKREQRQQLIFPLLWFVGIFAFFSISTEKRDLYLLPWLPAAALLAGKAMYDFILNSVDGSYRLLVFVPEVLTGALFAAAGIALFWVGLRGSHDVLPYLMVVGIALTACGVGLLALGSFQRHGAAFLVLVLVVGGLFFYSQRYVFSGVDDIKTLRNTIGQIAAHAGIPDISGTKRVK